jgi:addiction module HigA family antidote
MIWNIIDRRERCYRWKCVNAIIEPAWHDNSCLDSDQAEEDDPHAADYEKREGISLPEAVTWASAKPYAVTLYLYDEVRETSLAAHSLRGLPPSHPGVFLREDVLPYIEPSKTDFAKILGIEEARLQAILDEREAIGTEAALRLGKALGNGARFWLTLQLRYDIWAAEREFKVNIPKVKVSAFVIEGINCGEVIV